MRPGYQLFRDHKLTQRYDQQADYNICNCAYVTGQQQHTNCQEKKND